MLRIVPDLQKVHLNGIIIIQGYIQFDRSFDSTMI